MGCIVCSAAERNKGNQTNWIRLGKHRVLADLTVMMVINNIVIYLPHR